MARKSSDKRRPDRKRASDRYPEIDRESAYDLVYEEYKDAFEGTYDEDKNDGYYDLDNYDRDLERERARERTRDRKTERKPDNRKSKGSGSSERRKPDNKGKKSDKKKRKPVSNTVRRPEMPVPPQHDEDMLSEFSDETNTFYTDEHAERKARETVHKQKKKGKKPEKQRKPMSPTRRKLLRIFSSAAIITVVIVVGIVLSLTVLFKTQVYDITGNTRYTEAEITEASGIDIGENIFLAPKGAAEKSIKEKFPYVEDVSVGFSIPDTIKIDITEAVEGYLVKLSDKDYLVISTKGRILQHTNDRSAFNLPIFIGPAPVTGEPGDYVSYEDETVVDMIDSVTRTFADNGYTGITEIDATNMGDITFTYDNRIKVKLGIPEELDYKIRTAMTIIVEKLDSNGTGSTQGVLDVSRCNSTRRSYFNEQQVAPTNVAPKATQPSTGPADSGGEDWTDDGSGESAEGDWTYTEDAGTDEGLYDGSDDGSYEGSYEGSDEGSDEGSYDGAGGSSDDGGNGEE